MSDPHQPKQQPAPGGDARPLEDAGTQALAEALASSFKLVKVIMILLVIVFLGSGVREISSYERGIKLSFGRPVGAGEGALLRPGWHWAWPYPIDEIVKIPIGQVQEVTSTVGWYGRTKEQAATGIEPPMMPTLIKYSTGVWGCETPMQFNAALQRRKLNHRPRLKPPT